jgi:hypothetical protein
MGPGKSVWTGHAYSVKPLEGFLCMQYSLILAKAERGGLVGHPIHIYDGLSRACGLPLPGQYYILVT